jgi:hypothetical protein
MKRRLREKETLRLPGVCRGGTLEFFNNLLSEVLMFQPYTLRNL